MKIKHTQMRRRKEKN